MARAGLILIKDQNLAIIERYRNDQHYFIFPGGQVEDGGLSSDEDGGLPEDGGPVEDGGTDVDGGSVEEDGGLIEDGGVMPDRPVISNLPNTTTTHWRATGSYKVLSSMPRAPRNNRWSGRWSERPATLFRPSTSRTVRWSGPAKAWRRAR